MKSALLSLVFRLYQRRFRRLKGWSFISNYCVGGTLSQLVGDAYNSPTVGLWIDNDSYREFCRRFPSIVREPLRRDDELSARLGYPVGDLSGVKIMFLHYATFEEAAASWARRVKRINYDKVLFICTARDDLESVSPESDGTFDADHLASFRALNYPRVLFTNSIGTDEPFAIAPPSRYHVEDLHSWLPLARTMTARHIQAITKR
jgi:hypothetical protein